LVGSQAKAGEMAGTLAITAATAAVAQINFYMRFVPVVLLRALKAGHFAAAILRSI
jgi:hypothetical protein